MPKITLHPSFKRAYKRQIAPGTDREKRFRSRLKQFSVEPFHPSLRTHKLKGTLFGYWSFSIEYDLRVIFFFEGEDEAVFFDLGTHDDVY